MADLDTLVGRARAATVRRAIAVDFVDDLDRLAARAPQAAPPRARASWVIAGVACAVAAAAIGWIAVGRGGPRVEPVQVGERVAIVAEPGTAYRVVTATADATTIAIDHGAVTARLWPGTRPHALVLEGGGITASATGTIYELAVRDGHGLVYVDQGSVEVAHAGEVHRVPAGAAWPDRARSSSHPGADALTAYELAMPVSTQTAAEAVDPVPAPPLSARDAGVMAPPDALAVVPVRAAPRAPTAPVTPIARDDRPEDAATTDVKERWRSARLLRGQGKFGDAVRSCLAIADSHDAIWSPIALVEALRIEAGPLADPDAAIGIADRMLREWPRDALTGETRALRCQALGQLGRGDECAPPSSP